MKLLFDENLSHKLSLLVFTSFPDSQHVRELGLKGRTDEEIWEHAKAKGYALISKDKDFYQRALLYGSPPKFIWLCLGNCTRDDLLNLIQRHERDILAFETSAESVLILS
jgi:predicted nuclease of predicted toxin-antitoxin system